MAGSLKELKRLIDVGRIPKQRTIGNFLNVVRGMERIDPNVAQRDLLSAFVHMAFYYRGPKLSSELEGLTPNWLRWIGYPKDDRSRLAQDQHKLNPTLRQAFVDYAKDIKRNWKLVRHPDGREVNLGHSLSALDCYLRSGSFKSWLFSNGGDYLKKLLGGEKLDRHDWVGNEVGEQLVEAYKDQQSRKKGSGKIADINLSEVLAFTYHKLTEKVAADRAAISRIPKRSESQRGPKPPTGLKVTHAGTQGHKRRGKFDSTTRFKVRLAQPPPHWFKPRQPQLFKPGLKPGLGLKSGMPKRRPFEQLRPAGHSKVPVFKLRRAPTVTIGPSIMERIRKQQHKQFRPRSRPTLVTKTGPREWWRRPGLRRPGGKLPGRPADRPGSKRIRPQKADRRIIHTVRQHDTLWDLSKHYYGSGRYWRQIWNANLKTVKNPHRIYYNKDKLVIPPQRRGRIGPHRR